VVKFNPPGTVYAATAAGYQSIPAWSGTDTTDGYISSTSYHTKDNVLAGRGDPCKLVGLTVEQIKAGTVDNGDWRLPTNAENGTTYGSPTFVNGAGWASGTTPTAGIYKGTIGTSFLPASGQRNPDGSTQHVGGDGHCWSSRAGDPTRGHLIYFSNNTVDTSSNNGAHYGLPVRCVPQ
jgi:hypothetical protein